MQSGTETIKSVITAYLFKHLDHFRINLDHAIEEFDPEAIHQYRVSVKRIRALVRMMNRLYDEPLFHDEFILPLRLMFKAGGTIRDDQVQRDLVEKIEKENNRYYPLIKEYYRRRIEERKNSFYLKTFDFDQDSITRIRSQVEETLAPLDETFLEQGIYNRLHNSMEKLKRKRYDLDQPEMLHRFRTRFKENGYVAEMFHFSEFTNRVTKSRYNRMKHFGQELGNWHDFYQLRVKTALIFQECRDEALLDESIALHKYITPLHDKLFQEILHLIKRDDSLFAI